MGPLGYALRYPGKLLDAYVVGNKGIPDIVHYNTRSKPGRPYPDLLTSTGGWLLILPMCHSKRRYHSFGLMVAIFSPRLNSQTNKFEDKKRIAV